jgi:RNA polymerase-interacting CarD/CdnL/TRCF family regulator
VIGARALVHDDEVADLVASLVEFPLDGICQWTRRERDQSSRLQSDYFIPARC